MSVASNHPNNDNISIAGDSMADVTNAGNQQLSMLLSQVNTKYLPTTLLQQRSPQRKKNVQTHDVNDAMSIATDNLQTMHQ